MMSALKWWVGPSRGPTPIRLPSSCRSGPRRRRFRGLWDGREGWSAFGFLFQLPASGHRFFDATVERGLRLAVLAAVEVVLAAFLCPLARRVLSHGEFEAFLPFAQRDGQGRVGGAREFRELIFHLQLLFGGNNNISIRMEIRILYRAAELAPYSLPAKSLTGDAGGEWQPGHVMHCEAHAHPLPHEIHDVRTGPLLTLFRRRASTLYVELHGNSPSLRVRR